MNDLMPPLLLSHARSGTSKFALALRITRADGLVFGMTSARAEVTIDGVRYDPAHGLDASAITSTAGFSVDNLEMTVADGGTVFRVQDVEGGIWRSARFLFFRYRWDNPAAGIEPILAGIFGDVSRRRGQTVVELRGLQQYLQQPLGMLTSRTCRARFADYPSRAGRARCGLVAADWTDNLTVSAVLSRRSFVAGVPVVPGGDTNYSSRSLIVHFDGANGATSAVDNGPLAKALTFNGNAQLSTAQSRFGTASLACDGSGDYVSALDGPELRFGTGDFCVELWMRPSSLGTRALIGKDWQIGSVNPAWGVALLSDGRVQGEIGTSPSTSDTIAGGSVTVGAWNHVAYTRSGSTTRLFLNGTQVASGTSTQNITNMGGSPGLAIGAGINGAFGFAGWIDEVRITKGLAVYTANFTPPTQAFPDFASASGSPDSASRPTDWYGNGVVRWTSGANSNMLCKVTAYNSDGTFTLQVPTPSDIEVGDTLAAVAGCRGRLLEDCRDRFDNVLNFQAEPHLPGVDALVAQPFSDV